MMCTARQSANDGGAANSTEWVLVVQGALNAPDTAGNPYGLMRKPPQWRLARNDVSISAHTSLSLRPTMPDVDTESVFAAAAPTQQHSSSASGSVTATRRPLHA